MSHPENRDDSCFSGKNFKFLPEKSIFKNYYRLAKKANRLLRQPLTLMLLTFLQVLTVRTSTEAFLN